jgi:hypothetical protein
MDKKKCVDNFIAISIYLKQIGAIASKRKDSGAGVDKKGKECRLRE